MSLPDTEPPFQSSHPSVRLRFDSRHRSQRSRTATSEVEGVRCSILTPNEREFLWRAADTKTLLNGTAAPARMEF